MEKEEQMYKDLVSEKQKFMESLKKRAYEDKDSDDAAAKMNTNFY